MEQALVYGTCVWMAFAKLLPTSLALVQFLILYIVKEQTGTPQKPGTHICPPAFAGAAELHVLLRSLSTGMLSSRMCYVQSWRPQHPRRSLSQELLHQFDSLWLLKIYLELFQSDKYYLVPHKLFHRWGSFLALIERWFMCLNHSPLLCAQLVYGSHTQAGSQRRIYLLPCQKKEKLNLLTLQFSQDSKG